MEAQQHLCIFDSMFRTRDDDRHDVGEIDRFIFMRCPFASTRKVLAGRGVDNESLEFRSGARHRLRRYDGGAINPVGKFTDHLLAAPHAETRGF